MGKFIAVMVHPDLRGTAVEPREIFVNVDHIISAVPYGAECEIQLTHMTAYMQRAYFGENAGIKKFTCKLSNLTA